MKCLVQKENLDVKKKKTNKQTFRKFPCRRNEFDSNQNFFSKKDMFQNTSFLPNRIQRQLLLSSFCLQYPSNIDDAKQHVIIIIFNLFPKWTPRKKKYINKKKNITAPLSWNQRSTKQSKSKKKVGQKRLLALSLTFVQACLAHNFQERI